MPGSTAPPTIRSNGTAPRSPPPRWRGCSSARSSCTATTWASLLGRPWPIDPGHAGLILGAYGPLFPHIVDPEAADGHTAGYAIDLGGGPILTVRFTDGIISLEPPGMGPVDVTICSDPVTFLMVADGRLSQYEAIALGRMSATGDHPELAVGFQEPLRQPVAAAHR